MTIRHALTGVAAAAALVAGGSVAPAAAAATPAVTGQAPSHRAVAPHNIYTDVVPATSAPSARPAPTTTRVLPSASHPCNTSFIPAAPHGAPMIQYYRNCANYTKRVCPGLTTSQGTKIWTAEWQIVDPGATVSWTYPSTVQTGQYTTVYC